MYSFYESHIHKDPDFPIIFHFDTVRQERPAITHWHENLEIIYFTEGECIVSSDMVQSRASAGDIAVINSGNLHSFRAVNAYCRYYCLIIDKTFCDKFSIDIETHHFSTIVRDKTAQLCFDKIVQEMLEKAPYYKTAVKSGILNLLVFLCRHAVIASSELADMQNSGKIAMVKASISYIRQHYKEDLTIDTICTSIGFSKYYFCRVFKEITGKTVVDYINFLRCGHAQTLLSSGNYNVSQSAEMSGIHNLSYFSKIYKKQMGISPSQEKQI